MPPQPIRRSPSIQLTRRAAGATPTRAELDAVRLAVEDLKSRLDPVPARLAQANRAIEAQSKRIEALVAGLETSRVTLEATRADMAALADAQARGFLPRLLDRLRALRPSPKPAAPAPVVPEMPQPAPVAAKPNWVLAGGRASPQARAVMVALFGLSPAEIDGVVAKLAAVETDSGELVRVFLTDSNDFDPFRRRGLPFEYLPPPPPEKARRGQRDWSMYQLRRFALLCDKWQPVEVVGFGPAAAATLAAWQASPHLPNSVRQLLAVADDVPTRGPAEA